VVMYCYLYIPYYRGISGKVGGGQGVRAESEACHAECEPIARAGSLTHSCCVEEIISRGSSERRF
jgi:hypothetical protein